MWSCFRAGESPGGFQRQSAPGFCHRQARDVLAVSSPLVHLRHGRSKRERPTTIAQELNDALYGTEWNINDKKNMLGMPQKKKYREAYIKIERIKSPAARAAAREAAMPCKHSGSQRRSQPVYG